MQNFRELKVWNKAHTVTLGTYSATENFPASERYDLTSQMRRAAMSIAANIAEGCGRSSDADSRASFTLLVLLARDLRLIADNTYNAILADVHEVKRMLSALIARLKADS